MLTIFASEFISHSRKGNAKSAYHPRYALFAFIRHPVAEWLSIISQRQAGASGYLNYSKTRHIAIPFGAVLIILVPHVALSHDRI